MDSPRFSVRDASFAEGRCGVRVFQSGGMFDNIQIINLSKSYAAVVLYCSKHSIASSDTEYGRLDCACGNTRGRFMITVTTAETNGGE
jgi:hypothetical protein